MIVVAKNRIKFRGRYYRASEKIDIDDNQIIEYLARAGAIENANIEVELLDDKSSLEDMGIRELKRKAKELKIHYDKKVKKDELVDLILEAMENGA